MYSVFDFVEKELKWIGVTGKVDFNDATEWRKIVTQQRRSLGSNIK